MIEYTKTLYSRNQKGDILKWNIKVVDNATFATIITEYGQLSGKLATTSRSVHTGKNIGKSNETTYLEQAISEAKSDTAHKRKEGYKSLADMGISIKTNGEVYIGEDKTNDTLLNAIDSQLPDIKTDSNNISKPMKCQPFRMGKMKYPCYGQPKINGGRAIARLEDNTSKDLFDTADKKWILRSKEGDTLTIPHIEDILSILPNCSYDGEIYKEKEHVTSINGAARNIKNPINKELSFLIFDIAQDKLKQKDRIFTLDSIYENNKIKGNLGQIFINTGICMVDIKPITFVHSTLISSDEEAIAYRRMCIDAGFEGCVLRDMNAFYRFGSRPITMMKLKEHIDGEFEVLNIIPQESDESLPMFIMKNDVSDEFFESTPTGSHDFQRQLLIYKDLYIGTMQTVRYRERTITRKPFHSNVINIKQLW